MTSFAVKSVLSEYKSMGDELRLARTRKGWSVEDVAKILKTSPHQIEALEEENYSSLAGGIYGKILFKKYVQLLDLNYRSLLKLFLKDRPKKEIRDVFFSQTVKRNELAIMPKTIRNLAVGLIVLICFVYLGYYLRKITTPPKLELWSPKANQVQNTVSGEINGQTEPESELTINGEAVLIDGQGKFSREITLKEGVNNIVVKSKKKYSQEQIVSRQILVEINK